MYQSFYGFSEKPFSLLPDSSFLYLSKKHRMALTLLEYGLMNQAGFTTITGQIGTGKTTLIRHMLGNMEQQHTVGLISNTHRSFGELLQWILMAFGLPHANKSKVELYQDFMTFIIEQYANGKRTVLIVDEAQNMSAQTLEELRMLSNVNADKDQVLQVILVGQKELRETLRRPDLVQFAQRIAVDYHLDPLLPDETSEYIRHRISVAGCTTDLFSDEACGLIHSASSGVPRLINLLCDTALVYGYAEQSTTIGTNLVKELISEKQQGGLFPTQPEAPLETRASRASVNSRPMATTPANNKPSALAGNAKPVLDTLLNKKLRVAIACEIETLRRDLTEVLTASGIEVVCSVPLEKLQLSLLNPNDMDILLVELDEDAEHRVDNLYEWLTNWEHPVLFNESDVTEQQLQKEGHEFGRKLTIKLASMLPEFSPESPWHH